MEVERKLQQHYEGKLLMQKIKILKKLMFGVMENKQEVFFILMIA
jgi:hypothetical protein